MTGLLDPDCRAGKHGSCVGGPCGCACHAEVVDLGALQLAHGTKPPRVRIDSQDSVVAGAIECFGSNADDTLRAYADEASRRLHKGRRHLKSVVS